MSAGYYLKLKLFCLPSLMSLFHVIGFGLKLGHLILMLCCWFLSLISMNWISSGTVMTAKTDFLSDGEQIWRKFWEKISGNTSKIHHHYSQYIVPKRVKRKWWRKLLVTWIVVWIVVSIWVFWYMNSQSMEKRKETLASMCDERARMLQDQFNVSMNHVQAMSILISTFYHTKDPSAIDQVKISVSFSFLYQWKSVLFSTTGSILHPLIS